MIALLAAIAIHLARTHEELEIVQRLSIRMLIAASLIQFVSQLCLNASLLLPLQACVTRLGFWELYLVRAGGFLAGSLVPVAGGLGVRLAYLRTRGLTYLDFTWATLLSNVLALGAAAVLAGLATGVLWIVAGRPPAGILAVSAGVLAMSVAATAASNCSRAQRATRSCNAGRGCLRRAVCGRAVSWRPGCSRIR